MTRDELIEKMARAYCLTGPFMPDKIGPNGGPRWKYYVEGAAAALTAIEEAGWANRADVLNEAAKVADDWGFSILQAPEDQLTVAHVEEICNDIGPNIATAIRALARPTEKENP